MSRIGVLTLMMPQSRKPTRPCVEEQVPDVGVAVDDGVRALVPQPLQLVVVVDVELGDLDERVGEAVAVVVDAVAQHRGRRSCSRGRLTVHPRRFGGAASRVVEADVQRGEVFDRARRPSRRGCPTCRPRPRTRS